jgi:ribosomal-protein-alanine N-acetyltransferase
MARLSDLSHRLGAGSIGGAVRIALMTEADVPEVSRLERKCFTNPWPQSAYRRELRNPTQNWYIVLREAEGGEGGDAINGFGGPRRGPLALISRVRRGSREPGSEERGAIVGFAGFWRLYDEAHITTIGVDPMQRGRSLGELLLVALIEEAIARGAGFMSLEVRVSNAVALNLYEKYGFQTKGVRPRYYVDDGEDAYVMWSPNIRTAEYRETLDELRARLAARLAGVAELPEPADAPFSAGEAAGSDAG